MVQIVTKGGSDIQVGTMTWLWAKRPGSRGSLRGGGKIFLASRAPEE